MIVICHVVWNLHYDLSGKIRKEILFKKQTRMRNGNK